jgi:hypothetical protein
MLPKQKEKRKLLYAGPDVRVPKRTRIAVLNSHPIQYFAPLYAYLNAAPDRAALADLTHAPHRCLINGWPPLNWSNLL